jgi:hypothetical protein
MSSFQEIWLALLTAVGAIATTITLAIAVQIVRERDKGSTSERKPHV